MRWGDIFIPCSFNFLRIFRGNFEMSLIDRFVNPEMYHEVPHRLNGELDEQYKLRLRAYSMGMKAGAASRQAEIDELQKKYDAMYNAFTVADDCRKEWHRCYIGVRQREDELQKRIDICEKLRDSQFEKLWALTQAIEVARNGVDEDFDLFLNYLSNILKGKKDE